MARLITNDAERHLRDELGLDKWLNKTEQRRRKYFKWIDRTRGELRDIYDSEPEDESIVLSLVGALSHDATLGAHVDGKRKDFFANQANWETMRHATAAVIFHEYLVAVERGRW